MIFLPFGENEDEYHFASPGLWVMRCRAEPSGRTRTMLPLVSDCSCEATAIHRPSGDQSGREASILHGVILLSPVPSRRIVKTACFSLL